MATNRTFIFGHCTQAHAYTAPVIRSAAPPLSSVAKRPKSSVHWYDPSAADYRADQRRPQARSTCKLLKLGGWGVRLPHTSSAQFQQLRYTTQSARRDNLISEIWRIEIGRYTRKPNWSLTSPSGWSFLFQHAKISPIRLFPPCRLFAVDLNECEGTPMGLGQTKEATQLRDGGAAATFGNEGRWLRSALTERRKKQQLRPPTLHREAPLIQLLEG